MGEIIDVVIRWAFVGAASVAGVFGLFILVVWLMWRSGG